MAPPSVTHIKSVLTIHPHEVDCWLDFVRPYLDAAAKLNDFAGYQFFREVGKAHQFLLEMSFRVDKAAVQGALDCPHHRAFEDACRTLVAAKETAIWAEGETPVGCGEHAGWRLIEKR